MERALNRDLIELALGGHERLPNPDELQQLMADAEVKLFLHRPRLPEEALSAGWYLHGIASSPSAYELYSPARQRRAFQISAHILYLALQDRGRNAIDRCRLAFGAAVGYRRGELEPNAMAVYRRARMLFDGIPDEFLDRVGFVPFEVGLTVLGSRHEPSRR